MISGRVPRPAVTEDDYSYAGVHKRAGLNHVMSHKVGQMMGIWRVYNADSSGENHRLSIICQMISSVNNQFLILYAPPCPTYCSTVCVIGFMTEGLNVKWGAVSPMKSTAKALIHVGFENKIVAFKLLKLGIFHQFLFH